MYLIGINFYLADRQIFYLIWDFSLSVKIGRSISKMWRKTWANYSKSDYQPMYIKPLNSG